MVCSLRTGLAVAVLANGSGGDNTTPAAASNGSSTPGSASLACGLGADVVDHMLSLAVASSTAEVQSVAVALLPALKAALAQCAGGATAQVRRLFPPYLQFHSMPSLYLAIHPSA